MIASQVILSHEVHSAHDRKEEKKARRVSTLTTVAFALTVLLFLILWKFITPIPPIPPDPEVMTLEVGLDDGTGGTADVLGGGSNGNTGHPGMTDPNQASGASNPTANSGSVTDNSADNNVNANPNGNSNQTSMTNDELQQLLANFNKNKGKGTIQIGGQGSGDPYTGGMGDGSGSGPGPGNGGDPGTNGNGGDPNGNSSGHVYRHIEFKPEITNPTQEEGIVVVIAHVDRSGHVTKTSVGPGGTTNNSLLEATATQKAYKIVFNADNGAPVDQAISVEIKFTLR